jgi:hypothetical protein
MPHDQAVLMDPSPEQDAPETDWSETLQPRFARNGPRRYITLGFGDRFADFDMGFCVPMVSKSACFQAPRASCEKVLLGDKKCVDW